jgi:DNA-binding transcriptional ArsR family regulator
MRYEQATLSQQLGVLRGRNLVRTRRNGTTIRYEIVLEDFAREDVRGTKPA